MNRANTIAPRTVVWLCVALAGVAAPRPGCAAGLDDLSSKDASNGLRAALGQGIDKAVAQLGAPDGFLANPKVAIPLPPALEKVDRGLRMVGMGGDADALKIAMNHAAESAVAEAKPVLRQALERMTVEDAKGILTGGDDSATAYFRRASADSLAARFKPIVARATARVKLASLYDQYAGKAAEFGLVKGEDAHLDDYVTSKALDGLFAQIADEERAIRRDPLGQASSLIKRVFGAVQ
jgi:Protein of unknown function (DUF4197)